MTLRLLQNPLKPVANFFGLNFGRGPHFLNEIAQPPTSNNGASEGRPRSQETRTNSCASLPLPIAADRSRRGGSVGGSDTVEKTSGRSGARLPAGPALIDQGRSGVALLLVPALLFPSPLFPSPSIPRQSHAGQSTPAHRQSPAHPRNPPSSAYRQRHGTQVGQGGSGGRPAR